jgi:hypothetical protein
MRPSRPTNLRAQRRDRPPRAPRAHHPRSWRDATPAPSATPVSEYGPVPDEDSLPVTASVERDGIRVTLELRFNPLIGGTSNTVRTTVENTSDEPLEWLVDCSMNVHVSARMEATWPRHEPSDDVRLRPYREWLLEESGADQPIGFDFLGVRQLGRRSYGCGDSGSGAKLEPGQSVSEELAWDGHANRRLGPPPSAPVTVTGTFRHWYRVDEEEGGTQGEPITVTLDSWLIFGRDLELLAPEAIVDAALADEAFASWLVEQPLRRSADAIVEYDWPSGLWIVGLAVNREDRSPMLHAAFLDPVSGEVLMIREHPIER